MAEVNEATMSELVPRRSGGGGGAEGGGEQAAKAIAVTGCAGCWVGGGIHSRLLIYILFAPDYLSQ